MQSSTFLITCICIFCTGESSCVPIVDVHQPGMYESKGRRQVIVPTYNFSCDGRITGYVISLAVTGINPAEFPTIQVWRRTSLSSYQREGQSKPDVDDITNDKGFHLANVSLTGTERIGFQSGDIIGYFLPSMNPNKFYGIRTIMNETYISYSQRPPRGANMPTTFEITADDVELENTWPLIKVKFGKIYLFHLYNI